MSGYQAVLFFIIYAFLGWCTETLVYSIKRRKVVNPGFVLTPFILTYGVIMVMLIAVLPSFGDNRVGQFVYTFILTAVIDSLGNFILRRLTGVAWPFRRDIFAGTVRGFLSTVCLSVAYFLLYQLFQPLLVFILPFISILPVRIIVWILFGLLIFDFVTTVGIVRRGQYADARKNSRSHRMAERINDLVWSRLEKVYPGVRETGTEETEETYTFAKGMSFDKLIWVFLISALLGDLIETLFCGFVNGKWMSRSSVLYGPFSFVWGIGAVILTIVLSPLAKKSDRWVFLGGFFAGGAYEYLCSVFTELVFGTVFWDYSHMPFNIGGRTNVLFMFFWGALSVVWVKNVYPAMSKAIEKIPPVAGKIITWAVCVTMLLNSALTGMAMLRYNSRQEHAAQNSQYEIFLDTQYPDEWMEKRWPNMRVVE